VTDESRVKRRERCLAKEDPAFFRGRQHSENTKARMVAVYEAKRVYQRQYGVSARVVTIAMIETAGIKIV
jgi:hypothetical protein